MIKISVIIPVYNASSFLQRCLESIKNQTYKNIEIICVDDGSTDGSGLIVDKISKNDSRFIIVHKSNKGESSARNIGLKIASGDYITFCDCDDWIEKNMYMEMVSEIEKYDLDIVASGWYKDTGSECCEIKNNELVNNEVFNSKSFLRYIYMRDSYRGFAYIWNKIYKRSLIIDQIGNMVLFDENIKLGGDVIFLAQMAYRANKIKYIDKAFYHYIQRNTSTYHCKSFEIWNDMLKSYQWVIDFFESNNVDKDVCDYVKRMYGYHSSNITEMAIDLRNEKELNRFKNHMRIYENEYKRLNLEYPERINRFDKLINAVL